MTALVVTPHAQSGDPAAQPRLTFNDLSYVGAFRLPASSNGDTFEFGGHALAFNPAGNSLFVSSRGNRVAEVSIPAPANTSNFAAMPFASYLQPFVDPTEGHLGEVGTDGVSIDSMLVFGNRLIGTASVYYDANNTQKLSHFSHGLQLNQPTFSGWSRVWDDKKTGFVSGAMSLVPTEWRGLLGGPAATGQCCIPIVMRTSVGPAAFSFDPAQVGQATVPANPLLYYDLDHPTLGIWDNSSPVYGSTTQMGGMAMVAGTRTVLYIGRNGMGAVCYGDGTTDQTLVGTMAGDGAHYCYDPTDSSKGQHAYPYRYQIWAYDLNDFAAVKSGAKQPWDVQPYAVFPFDFPTHDEAMKIGGVAYDAEHQLIYVSQMLVDKDGYAYRPLIHVLHVNATAGSVDPNDASSMPLPTTTVPPATTTTTTPVTTDAPVTTPSAGSNVVSAITLSVNKASPQVAGTAITFSAYAIGGVTPQEYKWLVHDGTGFKPVTGWSTSETFAWTPSAANAKYRVRVWARSSGNADDEPEAVATATFSITGAAAAPALPLRSVDISSDKAAPQPQGSAVTFTATTVGGSNLEYKWLIHDGVSWSTATGWSSQNTFAWTAGAANPSNRIGVWVRTAGNTAEGGEVTRSEDFAISAPLVVVPAVTTTTPPVVTTTTTTPVVTTTPPAPANGPAVTLTSTTMAPGATITFTVANGNGNNMSWVALYASGADDFRNYLQWQFMNATQTAPANGITAATLRFTAPQTPGTYNIRWFGDSGYTKIATSVTITVGTPTSTTTTTTPPATTTTTTTACAMCPTITPQSLTVRAGATVPFSALNGNGNNMSWVALYAAGAEDFRNYLQWQFMNSTQAAPSSGITSAALHFTAPAAPGTYNIRWFGDSGYTKIATSATITVVP